jgi:hypothetical protein
MAYPVDFTGINVVMKAPKGAEDVLDVGAFRNEQCCVTCWKLTEEELAEVAKSGLVYLTVLFGGGMPPVFLGSGTEVSALVARYGETFPVEAS